MEFKVFETYTDLSEAAADRVCRMIQSKPNAVLVFPTGNTPLGMFKALVERYKAGQVAFKDAYLFELDEYLHEPGQDGPVLFDWLEETFLSQMDFQKSRVFAFNPKTSDAHSECLGFQEQLDELGGADLVILGLGPNGHLAMNEPGTPFTALTHVAELTSSTLQSNAAYWQGEATVPAKGMTLGLKPIFEAKEVLLLVNGSSKQAILKKIIDSPATEQLPATILHDIPNSAVYADRQAFQS